MTASGGVETATIERRKNPAHIAIVTKELPARWVEPVATLAIVHADPVAAR